VFPIRSSPVDAHPTEAQRERLAVEQGAGLTNFDPPWLRPTPPPLPVQEGEVSFPYLLCNFYLRQLSSKLQILHNVSSLETFRSHSIQNFYSCTLIDGLNRGRTASFWTIRRLSKSVMFCMNCGTSCTSENFSSLLGQRFEWMAKLKMWVAYS
jgi:hypothetical protein